MRYSESESSNSPSLFSLDIETWSHIFQTSTFKKTTGCPSRSNVPVLQPQISLSTSICMIRLMILIIGCKYHTVPYDKNKLRQQQIRKFPAEKMPPKAKKKLEDEDLGLMKAARFGRVKNTVSSSCILRYSCNRAE